MKQVKMTASVIFFVGLGLVFAGAGCGAKDGDGKPSPTKFAKNSSEPKTPKKAHDHSGWWCDEHGVPEAECSLCLPSEDVKTRFKDKGDWCKLHDRAESQCFKCDPSRYLTFERKYVAKFGEKPERPPESEFTK